MDRSTLKPVCSEVSALFTLVALLLQLPGAYLRAVLSKRVRGEAAEGPEVAVPVFQAGEEGDEVCGNCRTSHFMGSTDIFFGH